MASDFFHITFSYIQVLVRLDIGQEFLPVGLVATAWYKKLCKNSMDYMVIICKPGLCNVTIKIIGGTYSLLGYK